MSFSLCPICKKDFRDCSHSVHEVTNFVENKKLTILIRKIVQEELAKEIKK